MKKWISSVFRAPPSSSAADDHATAPVETSALVAEAAVSRDGAQGKSDLPLAVSLSHTHTHTHTHTAPVRYCECLTKEEKVAWLHSENGQRVLSQRPVLLEYYRSGYIYRILDNKHWKVRLEEWLTVEDEETNPSSSATKKESSSPSVPYGLTLPRTEQEKERERDDWLGPRYSHTHTHLHTLFKEALTRYQGATLSLEERMHLLTEGYVILRGVVPTQITERALTAVSEIIHTDDELIHYVGSAHTRTQRERELQREQMSERMKKRRETDSLFLSGATNHVEVLALYYNSPVYHMIEHLLHARSHQSKSKTDKAQDFDKKEEKDALPFRMAVGAGQIAYRFSQPRPLHTTHTRPKIGGNSWHIDGLENGKYGSFSLLVGFPLNDQSEEFGGNFCVHPGSHTTLLPYLAQYYRRSDAVHRGESAEVYTQRMRETKRVARPSLGEPAQVCVSAGDVVLALHKTAHLGGPNYGESVRKMVFFRVSHREHAQRREASLENVWIEFEGVQEIAEMM